MSNRTIRLFARKALAMFSCLLLAFALVPAAAFVKAPEAEAATLTLQDLRVKFPNGSYWNHVGGTNNPDGVTWTPCRCNSPHNLTGGCDCNSFDGAIQCMGFAYKVAYDLYGSSPRGWSTAYSVANLKAGDVVRYQNDNHSVFVTAVSGNNVTLVECYGSDSSRCKIVWDRIVTKSELASTLTYVKVAPYELNAASHENKGGDFYAYIVQIDGWHHTANNGEANLVKASVNDPVDPHQIWHFIRQSDGSYEIKSEWDGLCLDAANSGTANGTNVCLFQDNDTANQRWYIDQSPGGPGYVLRTSYCSKVIDECGTGDYKLFDLNGGTRQTLSIYNLTQDGTQYQKVAPFRPNVTALKGEDGSTLITWKSSPLIGTCDNRTYNICVYQGENATGNPVYSAEGITDTSVSVNLESGPHTVIVRAINTKYKELYTDSYATTFTAQSEKEPASIDEGEYGILFAGNSNYAVGVENASVIHGANIELQGWSGSSAQVFNFVRNGNGTYSIRAACSGMALKASYGLLDNGTNIKQSDLIENEAAQQWFLEKNPDGTYSFRNAENNLYLHVADGNAFAGDNVHCFQHYDGINCKFILQAAGEKEHVWGEYVSDGNADCTHDGTKTAHCANCDAVNTVIEKGSALGHDLVPIEEIIGTCGESVKTYTCSRCGETIVKKTPATHKLVKVEAIKATCEDCGNTEHYKCTACGKLFANEDGTMALESNDVLLGALGHQELTYSELNKVNPTCTEEGSYDGIVVCGICGTELSREKHIVDPLGHSFGDWKTVTKADCTNLGKMKRECPSCGAAEYKSVPALGHSWEEWQTVSDATFATEGKRQHICSKCGSTESEVIPEMSKTDLTDCMVTLSATSYTYNAKAQKPSVSVKLPDGTALSKDVDYTVAYPSSCTAKGTYTVTVKAVSGNHPVKGSVSKTYTIKALDISKASPKMTLSTSTYAYTGAAKKPAVTVTAKVGGAAKTLMSAKTASGTAIKLTYAAGRTKVGTYKVTATGTGNYTGTVTKTFKIVPKKSYLKSVTPGASKLTVKMSYSAKSRTDQTGTYYQVGYRQKGTSTWKYAKATSSQTKTLTSLKKGKQYYVKVRAYKTVGSTKYYGAWSTTKLSAKVK